VLRAATTALRRHPAAERELGVGHPVQSHIRDSTNEVLRGPDDHPEVRARFGPQLSFVADTRYFLTANSYDYIEKIRKDHGYNPTPT
jgi:hypothetical protein